jgi:hypothetical protein
MAPAQVPPLHLDLTGGTVHQMATDQWGVGGSVITGMRIPLFCPLRNRNWVGDLGVAVILNYNYNLFPII